MGALTSKPYAFTARPWELAEREAFDIFDFAGSSVKLSIRGKEVIRILPNMRFSMSDEWISDVSRFSYDSISSDLRAEAVTLNCSNIHPVSNLSRLQPTNSWLEDFISFRIATVLLLDHFCFSYSRTFQFVDSALGFSNFSPHHPHTSFDIRFFPRHQLDHFLKALNQGLSNLFFFDFNVRYSLPILAVKIRQSASFSKRSLTIFNFGSSVNNLLGEINLSHQQSTSFNSIRFKTRISRLFSSGTSYYFFSFEFFSFYKYSISQFFLNCSIFLRNTSSVTQFELGFSSLPVLFSDPLRIPYKSSSPISGLLSAVYSTYVSSDFSKCFDLVVPLPHPYEDSYTYVLGNQITTLPPSISSPSGIIKFPLSFKLGYYSGFSPSDVHNSTHQLPVFVSKNAAKSLFNFTNYFTHFFSTQFQENSLNILLNVKRHNEFRSNYIYYL